MCRLVILQYCTVKLITLVISLALQTVRLFCDGHYEALEFDSVYVAVINMMSVTLALYGLLLYYKQAVIALVPYEPFWKFMTVNGIIFVTFWQSTSHDDHTYSLTNVLFNCTGIALGMIRDAGFISAVYSQDGTITTSDTVQAGYQNFMLCIETFIAAVSLWCAFPVCKGSSRSEGCISAVSIVSYHPNGISG